MRPPSKTLTDQELEIMKIVWERHAATVRDVYEALLERRRVAYTTVMTMMKILEQKGYLNRKQVERAYVYRPAQPKSRVIRARVRDFVNRVFNGSAEPLLVHLIEDRHLTADEIEEIRRLIGGRRERSPLARQPGRLERAGRSPDRGGKRGRVGLPTARAANPAGGLANVVGNLPVTSGRGTVAPRRGLEHRVHHGGSQAGLAEPPSGIFPALARGSALGAGLRLRRAGAVARRGVRQTAPLAARCAGVLAASAAPRSPARGSCAACGVSAVVFAIGSGNVWAVAAGGRVARPLRRIAGGHPGSHRLP